MINLFIDTNTFLSFYHLTNEDLEELKSLTRFLRKQIRFQLLTICFSKRLSGFGWGILLVRRGLFKQSGFSPAQVETLVKIPGLNHQVGWIIGDEDVHEFYKALLGNYADKHLVEKLTKLVAKEIPKGEEGSPDF